MVTGVGTDLVEIERVERALCRRPALAGRLFTDREIGYAEDRGRPGRHLAGRFAAKEAVIKCLGAEAGVSMREIEVVSGAPPQIVFHGGAARLAGGLDVRVSISHSETHATAMAVAQRS